MNKRDDSRPTGWILQNPAPTPQETLEVKAQAAAWLEYHGPLLQGLHTAIAADLEAKNGDSLMMWWTTLHGLANELHAILTAQPAEVRKDVTAQ